MRLFKTKLFARFASDNDIADEELRDAILHAEKGLIDADLGGGVIKQRLPREGAGRSGGFRSIILFRRADKAFFVYGFAKNDRSNIKRDELKAFRKLADTMLDLEAADLASAMKNGTITEIMRHG
jgi:hypothetical protein